jgi:hypothetical protein
MGDKITSGKATAQFDTNLDQMFTGLLATVAPNASRIMDQALTDIEKAAIPDWPKRQPTVREKNGKVTFYRDESKNSWRMFVRGKRLDANGNVVVYLKNTAPYSYMIRYGEDAQNAAGGSIIAPQGKRVADETLLKPMRKQANKVVKALANDLTGRL